MSIEVNYSTVDDLIKELESVKKTLALFGVDAGECQITIEEVYDKYVPAPTTVIYVNYKRLKNEQELAEYNANLERIQTYQKSEYERLKKVFGE
jgi:hypothetical protein